MGEGGASLIVEELERARATGGSPSCGSAQLQRTMTRSMTSPLPNGESCIRACAKHSPTRNWRPSRIDYVNAHASSTQLNDSLETASIKQVFGEHAQRIPVSGTKGYYAHPLGATGAIEAALCALPFGPAMDSAATIQL
jgi:3-oxoacyl-[acyl-carrier-protein] synthase II